ncbi:ATP-binding cassette domain-containing protein [Liquorilactobacillus satsumensis]|uniref:ATP-binding cassette domain-containing protein n=1 Tax=Liquorilactobacillus satsumensis TaxID=259059 RepID=UPI0039ED0B93
MGDVSETCEACGGKLYSKEALKSKSHGYNIADVLDLSIAEAAKAFKGDLASALNNLINVDLGYIKLGQSLDAFSGGELQRVKLAKILLQNQTNILVLDEPTSGLHEANVQNLIDLLKELIRQRSLSVIIIEHNLRIMGQADWIVDIGPLAGKNGGKLLFQGAPYTLVQQNNTLTAQAMKRYFIG